MNVRPYVTVFDLAPDALWETELVAELRTMLATDRDAAARPHLTTFSNWRLSGILRGLQWDTSSEQLFRS